MKENEITLFLSQYSDQVFNCAMHVREILMRYLPDIQEQIDISARMISYSYGKRYADTICVLIPSKKGLKLGFYKGNELPDLENLLKGTGKISRYIEIKDLGDILPEPFSVLLLEALKAYKIRNGYDTTIEKT